ncbi:hypothetical protein SAMN04488107_2946 [Geodermatophilus saharensis]|uniref:Uncharacterized protein n=2 Tax=Geodermatophilus saharensis TaxID=1137994 RepID=A0A239FBX8_9ACTN|nr:hypothetical protein SAMN04488107_2946 [Geodermatophilus saharensis]
MVTARLAHSYFGFALEGMAKYLRDPQGDDVGRDSSRLSDRVARALQGLQESKELLTVADDAEPSPDLLAALVQARDAVLDVDTTTDAKKHAPAAIADASEARARLGQLTRE